MLCKSDDRNKARHKPLYQSKEHTLDIELDQMKTKRVSSATIRLTGCLVTDFVDYWLLLAIGR